jgi:hypothetical protein
MKPTYVFLLGIASFALMAGNAGTARAQEKTATTQQDLPSLVGMFAIENHTGRTIHYQIKWGNGQWQNFTLRSGGLKHSYPLDNNGQAPTPYIRFDGVAKGHSRKVYQLGFNPVGYPGYGAGSNLTVPRGYGFWYSSDGSSLDLFVIY